MRKFDRGWSKFTDGRPVHRSTHSLKDSSYDVETVLHQGKLVHRARLMEYQGEEVNLCWGWEVCGTIDEAIRAADLAWLDYVPEIVLV